MHTTKLVSTQNELQEILLLQQANTKAHLSKTEIAEQGFLTVVHTTEQLEQLHTTHPSVIVKDGDTLAGYALVMPRECAKVVPILIPAFNTLDLLLYNGQLLKEANWYMMGQVCVAKPSRGMGVFKMLYDGHRDLLKNQYEYCVTEISVNNKRSLRAHEKVGFKTLHQYTDATDEWVIVIWDWS